MKRILSILLLSLFAAVTLAGTEVYIPTLKTPADNAVDQMPNVTISWNAIVGSTGLKYEVQIDTSANFNSSKLTDTTLTLLTGYTTHELLFGVKYKWRVRAIDLGQTSGWSVARAFTVFTQVTLSFPKTNAKEDTLGPTQSLTWSNQIGGKTITGVKYFDLQVDTSQNFNSTQLFSATVASSKYNYKISNLRFGCKYYWRVRARHNLSASSWSVVFNFTVTTYIVQTLPTSNAVDQFLNALLKWKPLKGLLGYEYQLATDTGFTNVIAGSEVDTNFVNSQYTVFGKKYYWRVRGRHLTDTMQWCPRYAFTTIDKVKLLGPGNNSTNIAIKPTLKWTKQTGIVKYQLQLDMNENFSTVLVDVKLSDTISQYVVTKKLTNNTKYFWRMRAYSDSQVPDTSGWSEVWNFTTLLTGIGENGMLSSNIYPNPASGKVNIKMDVEEPAKLQVTVIDLLGSTFIREEFDLTTGSNIRELNLSTLSKGIYIVRLSYDGNVSNHKLIVDR
ncbi:MAG: T9SS type A sorting domain-containing protein [Bacteroidetes bacterium]|nr:T9SS type A sorting domain-containing protein [Bacteroidota bacterium]